ncbi:MAG: hypothetical protein JNM77_01575 [Pseudonocardia sp.]|nr:hypothetical protein [Pseudonocardia sp.]
MTTNNVPVNVHASTRTLLRLPGILGRAAVTVSVAGAVAAGLALSVVTTAPPAGAPGVAGPSAPARVGTMSSSSIELVAFCPFGTHHGPGSGCRGGSINDNARVNRAAAKTGRMYVDAAECAGKAVGKSVWKNRKKPSVGGVALGTISPALRCGHTKGY